MWDDWDRGRAQADVAEIMGYMRTEAQRFIPDPGAERLYGEDDAPYIPAGSFPCELREAPPELLASKSASSGGDAVMDFPPGQELADGDRVLVNGVMYRALTVEPENLFGAVTHKTAKLVKLNEN